MEKYSKAITALAEIILKGTPEAEQIKKRIEDLEKLQKENKTGRGCSLENQSCHEGWHGKDGH